MKKIILLSFLLLNLNIFSQLQDDNCELKNLTTFILDVTYDGSSEKLLKYFTTHEFVKSQIETNIPQLIESNNSTNYSCYIWLEFIIHENKEVPNQFSGIVELRLSRNVDILGVDCDNERSLYQASIVYRTYKLILMNPNLFNSDLSTFFDGISIELLNKFAIDFKKSNK